ncbi:hypothetical protein OnM2_097013 [Erysiphe neolycopersici]|uniref:DRBM domain-containing protein n=1 Tax=Erysiphe neolycopersici TaxID=212602 RepID=A0A420HAI0_9PEZI|nr:hypothetical protein OnM2_097013 [Erysiphe neolycopersici]
MADEQQRRLYNFCISRGWNEPQYSTMFTKPTFRSTVLVQGQSFSGLRSDSEEGAREDAARNACFQLGVS